MSDLSIRPSRSFNRGVCECCGKERITVWGLVPKSGSAYALYYGHMHADEVSQPRRMLSLAICLGDWSDERIPPAVDYVHIKVGQDSHMTIHDADESLVFSKKFLGKPMTREQALQSCLKGEFLDVAEFVIANDPAIRSFVSGFLIDFQGRRQD